MKHPTQQIGHPAEKTTKRRNENYNNRYDIIKLISRHDFNKSTIYL